MWQIKRNIKSGNETLKQFVYSCRTENEAKEKLVSYDEEGLFIEEVVQTREDYIERLIDKGYRIESIKAILENESEHIKSTYLIFHYAHECEERGYEEGYSLQRLSYLGKNKELIEVATVDKFGNYVGLDGTLIEENLDKIQTK